MSELPNFNSDSGVVIIDEPIPPKKKTVHERTEGTPKKEYICKATGCDFDTDAKGAYTNHKKSHEKDVRELYKSSNVLKVSIPISQ